jgi:hypothetical protein
MTAKTIALSDYRPVPAEARAVFLSVQAATHEAGRAFSSGFMTEASRQRAIAMLVQAEKFNRIVRKELRKSK